MLKLSDPVVYVDTHGTARGAVLTTIWGNADYASTKDAHGNILETDDPAPTVNLVFTSGDEDRRDNGGCGRQIERGSSVVHASRQNVFGNYWRRVDEVGKETEK
jgi:hypothetical protein